MMNEAWIEPCWHAPASVRSLCTTRAGGNSTGPWKSLNLGANCGDDAAAVRKNRAVLRAFLPADPHWLRQEHGARVLDHRHTGSVPSADAQVATGPGQVCVVLTADCLPVLFCNSRGTRVAAAHAGWRGLAAGILENTVQSLREPPDQLLAWLGPAIGRGAYEVGDEVRAAFPGGDDSVSACFERHGKRWLFDLYAMARHRLERVGVVNVTGGGYCTYTDSERFFSHRRDGCTGRMASLIWLQA